MKDNNHDSISSIIPLQHNNNQARLRLVKSEDFDLCSSCNLTAASPLGSEVRPVSMSLTEEGVSPTSVPISANVIPLLRRSVMRDAQVIMPPNIRHTVSLSQRLPVTEFRENNDMPKPPGMPGKGSTLGKRVRFWREFRRRQGHEGFTQVAFAKQVGYSPSGLSDLENDRSEQSERSHVMAAKLGLNPHYMDTGEGEPEANFPQDPPPPAEEPLFPSIPRSKFKRYNRIELSYIETAVIKAMNDIETERRNKSG